MPLSFRQLGTCFAAEVSPIDLRQVHDPAILAELRAGMDRYAVLVFRDQPFTDEEQLAFAQRFDGTLHAQTSAAVIAKNRFGNEALTDISNVGADGGILPPDDRRRMSGISNRLWHTDASFVDPAGRYSMLSARVLPPVRADTEFADMRAAWDALPESTQTRLRGLIARHSLLYSRAQLGFSGFSEAEREQFAPVPQRLVRRVPGSNRLSLYLSSHIGAIEGMPVPEAMAMVRDLIEHATQRQFVYRHVWRVHDLVMWDNRATMHRARAFEDNRQPRDMRRATLQDAAPTLEQPA